MKKKRVAILGSTGSIGESTLKVIRRYSDYFDVVALSAYNSICSLEKQINEFQPQFVAVPDKKRQQLGEKIKSTTTIIDVDTDLEQIVQHDHVDIVVIGMRGASALKPFLAAAQAGKVIAPANKEALVIAGHLIVEVAHQNGATIVPVDSEQSAIFQCLRGEKRGELRRVILTASGGALRNVPQQDFDLLTVDDILKHPRWKMGPKITVDSATLMNKGFEVIEAQRLFNLNIDQINVVVHPEAIVHSLVEYVDGSMIAQLAPTDMQLPIQFAMTYPDRLSTQTRPLDLVELGSLNFEKPDTDKFPLLSLAFEVAKIGGSLPSVLNAADEIAVEAFLKCKIKFNDIVNIVEKVIQKHCVIHAPKLDDIIQTDQWARDIAQELVEESRQ